MVFRSLFITLVKICETSPEITMEGNDHLKNFTVGSLPTLIYIPNFISESEQTQLLHHIYQAPISKWKSLKNRRLQNWGGVVHEKGLIPQDLPPWLIYVTKRMTEETGLFPSPINHVLINEYLPDQGIMPHQDGPAYHPVVAILSLESPVVMNFTPHPRLRDSISKAINASDKSNLNDGKTDSEADTYMKKLTSKQTDDHQSFSILLMPQSLLIFKDMAYSEYLHGIEDSKEHCLERVVNVSEAMDHQQNHLFSSEETLGTEGNKQRKNLHRSATRVSLTCRLVPKVHRNLFKF